ncbi:MULTISPECIES: hypothetical protein [Pseudomonas]|uniref:Uncharacterized protein n=3 Tax=Pseudomonas syringae group genomosp. 2 TaxID=251698 RepID=A0AAX1VMQ7_PSEAJ|nr:MULTISPECIES: hypothetical protein [Pseudomonas syringae group]KPX77366.1 Uncharacterized protein ALO35_00906 [Pseudomonas amygdali pv. lachrymans]KIY18860.1 hypothetical protein RD00_10745 [Pseudomonas amygdali pv. tabaci]KPY81919.1 Uncharacterized protein ALO60_03365 [Pseudomonas amygdali pv. tabaci]MDU8631466.1 hypothetical protein [Pseudomonas syringae group sp. 243L2]QOI06153.1 hypothetical protein D5S10_21200 [Pseudomonas savastanoi]
MHTEKLITILTDIEKLTNKQPELLKLIENLDAIHQELPKILSQLLIITSPNNLRTEAHEKHNLLLTKVNSSLRKSRFSTITKAAHGIEELLHLQEVSFFDNAAFDIKNIVDAIDDHLSNSSIETSLKLINSAHELKKSLLEIKACKKLLLETTAKELSIENEKNETFKIYFPQHISLSQFTAKTDALNSIIEECCNLVGLSVQEAAVEIKKIESGSYFAKISANPLVVILLTTIINNGSNYFFKELENNNTTPLRESSDIIDKLLKIRETLATNGHDVKNIDENIKKSSLIISKQLEKLLENTQQIEVNDHTIQTRNYDQLPIEVKKQLNSGQTQAKIENLEQPKK